MANDYGYILKVSKLVVKLQDQTLLDYVSFNVKKGTTSAILGPNGAGKTVLLRALLRLIPLTDSINGYRK